MKIVHGPVEILSKEIQTWDTPFVELDCFGTDSADQIAAIMNEFCRAHLGARLRGYLFYYDWDSLAFRPENELVGISAHGFTADWMLEGVRRIPTADDIRAFVADYEAARGAPFSKRERRSLFATCVYCIAYGARCAHSLEPHKTDWEENSWPYLLRTEGEALLRESKATR